MTAQPAPDADDPDRLVQCNVRIPYHLREAIDARRAHFTNGDGKPLSRDAWMIKALTAAVNRPLNPPTPTSPGMRTAPPPHRRPAT